MPLTSRTALPRARRSVAVLAALILVTTGLAACSAEGDVERDIDAFLDGWTTGSLHDVGFLNPAGQRIAADTVATEIAALVGISATPRRNSRAAATSGSRATAPTPPSACSGPLPGTRGRGLHPADQASARRRRQVAGHLGAGAGARGHDQRRPAGRDPPDRSPRGGARRGRQPISRPGRWSPSAWSRRSPPNPADSSPGTWTPPSRPSARGSPRRRSLRAARLAEAKPDAFVEVVTLRHEAYDQINAPHLRPARHPVPRGAR